MRGGEIARVRPKSLADLWGLKKGERILSINGEPLSHYIQFEKLTFLDRLSLELLDREGERRSLLLKKREGEPLGLQLYGYIYDGLNMCQNRCLFCFVDQQPKGMRRTLSLKDDDYRFSFYQGSYITMTNLEERDLMIIEEESMSPLYISIHTTNPSLREKMLGNRRAGEILSQLTRLKEAGISFHGQVVLCPSINDGEELLRTIKDLESFYPYLVSLSLIPVGLTSHRNGLPLLRPYTSKEAEEIVDLVLDLQPSYKKRFGDNRIYAADELFFLAGRPTQDVEEYDDFPQYQNGVGMISSFYQEVRDYLEAGHRLPTGLFYFITSTMGAKVLEPFVGEMEREGLYLQPIVVKNKTFGERVTVSGLLTGKDVWEALEEVSPKRPVLLPGHLFNEDLLFLDDIPLQQLREHCQAPLLVSPPTGEGFLTTLCQEVSSS